MMSDASGGGDDGSQRPSTEFDLDEHRRRAVDGYKDVYRDYEAYASALRQILRACLLAKDLRVSAVEARPKSVESLGEKAGRASDLDPSQPMYPNPLEDITDLAAARVITFFQRDVEVVCQVVEAEFDVVERTDKSVALREENKLGYQSVHYLVQLSDRRQDLPENASFRGRTAEIQVRTILQHAWAEIEHDIEYKSVVALPGSIKRRFTELAGLLEIGDREFQAIADANDELVAEARESVAEGRFGGLEITPDSLRAYLNTRIGPDARVVEGWYPYFAWSVLPTLGFQTLDELDECLKGLNGLEIDRLLYGTGQGQITRFQNILLATLGDRFIELDPITRTDSGLADWRRGQLEVLRKSGISVGQCSQGQENSTVRPN
jgi:ppGpp synthetase/RelA/SpoT-type nucleotidyltranferase